MNDDLNILFCSVFFRGSREDNSEGTLGKTDMVTVHA